jgi:salicylate hydroxylase
LLQYHRLPFTSAAEASSTLSMKSIHVVVVGAGIGGLQTALALSSRGHTVTVLEAVEKFLEVGAGIRVPPNSNILSRSWGVDFSRIKKCVSMGNRFLDWKGNVLLDVGFEGTEKKYGAPYYFLHRADLVQLLLDTVRERQGVEVRMGTRAVEYDFEKPAVKTELGDWVECDLIVCADGIKSAVRDEINGGSCEPMDTGDVAYRILVDAKPLLEDPNMKDLVEQPWARHWIGPEGHAVGYPLRGGELYNIIIDITHATDLGEPVREGEWKSQADNSELVGRFKDWCEPVKKVCGLTGQYLKWKLADFDQLERWVHPDGKAVLLGDSCHPMMPYMAQGAAQATEDAACLSAVLEHFDDLREALKAYQKQRLPRATNVARNTRILQQWWHLHDGAMRDKRDEMMRHNNAENPMFWGYSERKDWLFGYDARLILPDGLEPIVPSLPPMPPSEASVYGKRS